MSNTTVTPPLTLLGPSAREEALEAELLLMKAGILAHAHYLAREVGAHGSQAGTYGAGNDQMAVRALRNLRIRFPEVVS